MKNDSSKTIGLPDFFERCKRAVDDALENLVPAGDVEPKNLHRAMRWSLFAGGKRFRPALAFAVGETFGAPNQTLRRAAAAIEMIHAYSLIHDDLPAMDDDDLRRGRATCHKKFDEATAILAGDVLQTLAFQAIAEDENLNWETRVRLISELARRAGTPLGMVAGQHLDTEAEGRAISVAELETIHRSKTGALICAAAHFGAIVADADKNEFAAISEYAAHLGLLFQITDDLLDVTQTTEALGKTAGKDASAKKATYPAIYGLDETANLARKNHAQACEALSQIGKDTSRLRELADFILNRQA